MDLRVLRRGDWSVLSVGLGVVPAAAKWLFLQLGLLFVGVLTLKQKPYSFGVSIWAPDLWKLPSTEGVSTDLAALGAGEPDLQVGALLGPTMGSERKLSRAAGGTKTFQLLGCSLGT